MRWIISTLLRVVVFSIIWVALSGASGDMLVYGIVAVIAATALSLGLMRPGQPQPKRWPARVWGTIVLAAWFLQQSIRGGIDVARRALTRRVDIAPEVVDVDVELPEGPAREVCYLLMNLLPGSMVQRVRTTELGTIAEVHTLSMDLNPEDQWQRLQDRVQQAFQVDKHDSTDR